MTEKRFSHDGVVIIDHLKEDLIYIDGKDNLLELAEYVDKLQGENEQLKNELEKLSYANEDLLEEKRIWKQMSDEYTKLSDENEQLKIKLEDIALDIENAKESNDDAQYELYKIKKENEQLKADKQALIDFIRKEFPKSYKHILEGFND